MSFGPQKDSTGKCNPGQSFAYFRGVGEYGPWAGLARSGFNNYLTRSFDIATLKYMELWLLGYEIGAANAAFLLHKRLAKECTALLILIRSMWLSLHFRT